MNNLTKNLKEFLTANEFKPKSRAAIKAEICYCQGYVAALPEGDEKKQLSQICGIFHFAGRSIL
jgi:hypothetical protein